MLWIILAIIVSYLLGSIPTAYIFVRLIKGVDIRKIGSGNVGATNALRVLGTPLGIIVLLLDILKGFVAVYFLGDILLKNVAFSDEVARILLGIACICGHNWTVFLNFKGGKGVATTIGVLLALSIKVAGIKLILFMLLAWVLVFLIFRIVSIASVISSITIPVYMFFFKQSKVLLIASILLSIFIILRHKANLSRFFQGKEPKLKFKK